MGMGVGVGLCVDEGVLVGVGVGRCVHMPVGIFVCL